MATTESGAVYLSWIVADDGTISGSAQIASLSLDGTTVDSSPHSITGFRSGGGYSIVIASQTWMATADGEGLVVSAPGRSGGVATLVFVPGSAAVFNDALDDLRAVAMRNAQEISEASIAEAEADRRRSRLVSIGEDAVSLMTLTNLSDRYVDLDRSLDELAAGVDDVAARAGDCFELPYAVDTVRYLADSVGFLADALRADADEINGKADKLQEAVSQLGPANGRRSSHRRRGGRCDQPSREHCGRTNPARSSGCRPSRSAGELGSNG